jgi:hypothetical protein
VSIISFDQNKDPIITKLAMIARFTRQEYVGIVAAKKTDVEVEAWYDTFYAATNVNLQNLMTIDGVNLLVSKNLLTPERANEILTAPVQFNERPS